MISIASHAITPHLTWEMAVKRVIHLIPADGIGGVECAAATMKQLEDGDISFQVWTIFSSNLANHRVVIPDLLSYWRVLRKLKQNRPDLLIVSLWRPYIVGILIKVFLPKLKIIAFLHSSKSAHVVDLVVTWLICRIASFIWVDSSATGSSRVPAKRRQKVRIISFVRHRLNGLSREIEHSPVLIYWGRLTKSKRLDRAIQIFSGVVKKIPGAKFFIIGPDGGELGSARRLVDHLNLSQSVAFTGPLSFQDIISRAASAAVYLQTSDTEGMAMSVVEAMQLGLVPAVTAVGEIKNYCIHGENSIIIDDDNIATDQIVALLSSYEYFKILQARAASKWMNAVLYRDDVMYACRDVLEITCLE